VRWGEESLSLERTIDVPGVLEWLMNGLEGFVICKRQDCDDFAHNNLAKR
jgi:hypothetical protein